MLVTGLLTLRTGVDDDLPATPPRQNPVVAVMAAPDMHASSRALRGGGTVNVIISRELHQAVVLADRWPRLDATHDYQLWIVGPAGNARPADVLIDGTERPSPRLVSGLNPGDQLAITEEPAGGSPRPTTTALAITDHT